MTEATSTLISSSHFCLWNGFLHAKNLKRKSKKSSPFNMINIRGIVSRKKKDWTYGSSRASILADKSLQSVR